MLALSVPEGLDRERRRGRGCLDALLQRDGEQRDAHVGAAEVDGDRGTNAGEEREALARDEGEPRVLGEQDDGHEADIGGEATDDREGDGRVDLVED